MDAKPRWLGGLENLIEAWRPGFGNLYGREASSRFPKNALHSKKSHFSRDLHAKSGALLDALDLISSVSI